MSFFELTMLTGAFLLLAFAVQLFAYTRGNLLLNKLLAFILLGRAIQDIFILLISLDIKDNILFVISIVPLIMFLVPPAIYLYIRSFVYDHSKLRRIDLIHLIPVILVIINYIPFLISPLPLKLDFFNLGLSNSPLAMSKDLLLIPISIQFMIRPIMLLGYLFFSWRIVINLLSNVGRKIHSVEKYYLIFFLILITIQTFSSLVTSIYIILHNQPIRLIIHNSGLMILSTALMLLFIVWILRHPQVLYGNMIYRDNIVESPAEIIIPVVNLAESDPPTETKILLSDNQVAIYVKRLNNFMEAKKPFVNPELNIQLLSNNLNIPLHHCSYLLNQIINKSFRDYLNGYRVSYFIKLYNQNPARYTIEALAQEVGFRNRSTFNIVFKKEIGLTPSEYFNL